MKLKLIRYMVKRKLLNIKTHCKLGVSLLLIMTGVRLARAGARLAELLEGGGKRWK